MKFGEKLRRLRAEKHISQEEAARAAGISRRAYGSYEQDGVYPRNREIYARLASLFSCDVNYLLTEDEDFVTSAGEKYGPRGSAQARELVREATALFAGGELADEDKDEVLRAIQEAYWIAKERNRKYKGGGGHDGRA